MRKFFSALVAMLGLFGLVASTAGASSVHLKGGSNAEPSFTDLGLALRSTGALAGLGNADILITVEADADVTATCQNPGTGEHFPPGQNPAPATVSGEQLIPKEDFDKNGNVSFAVTTIEPESPVPNAPDCPNKKWTEEITDLAFTSAIITVEQPVGTPVLTVSCFFVPATSDGAVSKNSVTCVQS